MQSLAEASTILSTSSNFLSSQDSKPLIGLKQDGMTGGYLLTYGIQPIDKSLFMEILTTKYYSFEYIENKINHIKKVHKWKGLTEEKINEIRKKFLIQCKEEQITIMDEVNKNIPILLDLKKKFKNTSDLEEKRKVKEEHDIILNKNKSLRERWNTLENDFEQLLEEEASDTLLYTGHSLFSFLLKDDFEYFNDNKASPDGKPIFITRGVLISGTLTKAAIGNASGSLIHHIAKDYGNDEGINFVSYYQILINHYLLHRGFSVGMEDCIPKNTDLIEREIEKCFLEASIAMINEKDPELLEAKVNGMLNKAATIGQKIAKDALDPKNNLVSMIKSGAKGNDFNIAQITGVVGQQNIGGKRIQKIFGGRTLPHTVKISNFQNAPDIIPKHLENDTKYLQKMFEGRGFIKNSFYRGLNPLEFWMAASGGREGLLSTAISTASTGYISRKLAAMLDSISINYLGAVNHLCNDNIVQFAYGSDGLDAARLIKTNYGVSCIDIKHVTDKLNAEKEFK